VKITPDLIADIVESIGLGMTRRAAAGAAGVSSTMLTSWEKRAKASRGKARQIIQAIEKAEARFTKEQYADISDLSPVEFAERHLRSCCRRLARAEEAGSTQAAMMGARQVAKAYAAVAVARAAGGAGLDEMSKEEFSAVIASLCEGMAEEHFQLIFRSYEELRRGRLVFVAEGGKAAES